MKKALMLAEDERFDLCIFDINVPDGDGFSFDTVKEALVF